MPLNAEERKILLALAEVVTPAGEVLAPPGEALVGEVEGVLEAIAPGALEGYGYALRAFDWMGAALCAGRQRHRPDEAALVASELDRVGGR